MLKTIVSTVFFFVFLLCFTVASVQAELVSALKIKAEYIPDATYEVGFDLNPKDGVIDRVYFNEAAGEPVFHTLDELRERFVVVFKKWGFNFVKLKIIKMASPTSGTIEISILKYAVAGVRMSLFYDVSFNPQTGRYDVVDRRTGTSLESALVRTNYKAGVPVGIKDIEPR